MPYYRSGIFLAFVMCMVLFSACTPENGATITTAPTQTLIPAQPTNTPTPTITPSPTGTEQPRPLDLALTATANVTPDATQQAFAQIQPLVQLASDDLVAYLDMDPAQIEFARQESETWSGATLDCGQATNAAVSDDASSDDVSSDEGSTEEPSVGVIDADAESDPVPGYRLLFIVGDMVYDYHTDLVDRVALCLETSLYDDYPELLLERDPVAAELTDLALQRLGRELDFPTRRIQIASVRPVTWEDTSLGCPLESQTYQQLEAPGYRIVLRVNDVDYFYHSDFERVIACDETS